MLTKNVYGIWMKWIMVVKDHFSGYTHTCALPSKHGKFVVHELNNLFGIIGYPKILQTDNGTEFTNQQVLALLKEWNPSIHSVTGRPSRPNDQGSVERVNNEVKKMLRALIVDHRNRQKDFNWVESLPYINASVNDYAGRARQGRYLHLPGDYLYCPVHELHIPMNVQSPEQEQHLVWQIVRARRLCTMENQRHQCATYGGTSSESHSATLYQCN
jgi:transposase InsO family protein